MWCQFFCKLTIQLHWKYTNVKPLRGSIQVIWTPLVARSWHGLVLYLQAVSSSIPENPNALSPWIHTTLSGELPDLLATLRENMAAAIANPVPTPIVPNVPASNLSWKERYKCCWLNTKIIQEYGIMMCLQVSLYSYKTFNGFKKGWNGSKLS